MMVVAPRSRFFLRLPALDFAFFCESGASTFNLYDAKATTAWSGFIATDGNGDDAKSPEKSLAPCSVFIWFIPFADFFRRAGTTTTVHVRGV